MFRHASSYASKWTLGLIITVVIGQISCKCVNNAAPVPKPQPKPAKIEEDPVTTLRPARIHPHRLTPPPLPSGSVDSYDSDQHKYNLTASGEYRNKYGINRYGVQREGEYKLGIEHWADDEVMLMFPRYPPLRSFEKHYGRYGGLNARRFWAHWNIPDDRSANGFHSAINSDNVLGGRPPPINSKDFEFTPDAYPKRYYMKSNENPKKRKRVQRAVPHLKNEANQQDLNYDWNMINPYDMGGRPPPGKTERRKRKTQEMAQTVVIRNKRRVTPQMDGEAQEKMRRVRRELDSDGHEERLVKRNKLDVHKRSAFRSWMSKIVPEHAAHIEKLHDKGIDKLMEQRVHGMEKTYGDLFHEHHEETHRENKLHQAEHESHRLNLHGEEHGPHHFEKHEGVEPHHFEMNEGAKPHHFEMHEGHEPHHFEMHEGHESHPLEMHANEHEAHHSAKERKAHHPNEAELEEEHKKKAHKSLLEELYLKDGKKNHDTKDKHEIEEHEEAAPAQTAAAPAQPQAQQQQQYQQQLYQQQQQNQMYQQQPNQQYNNYNNYGGGGGGGMGGMGMNGMGMGGMNGMGMGGMGMNGMGMNGMGMNGMGMNGMGMGQMGGLGAIINAVGNNLPKLSQQPAQAQQNQANYPQQTPQNYQQQNYQQNYPQSPAANGPDPNIQNAQEAAAAQQKAAQDQEAQLQQPDTQDSTAIQDKDQDTSQDSSANAKGAADASDDDIKADHSNDANDDLNLPSEDTINAQQDNNAQIDNEQNPQLDNIQQNPQFDNAQLGQFGQLDNGQNSVNMAAAAAG